MKKYLKFHRPRITVDYCICKSAHPLLNKKEKQEQKHGSNLQIIHSCDNYKTPHTRTQKRAHCYLTIH